MRLNNLAYIVLRYLYTELSLAAAITAIMTIIYIGGLEDPRAGAFDYCIGHTYAYGLITVLLLLGACAIDKLLSGAERQEIIKYALLYEAT